jgi:N5-(cytidine 5'-diphosphoramidyl)-L-glutamine hydrolase
MKQNQPDKIALVSMRVDVVESYGEVRDALDENLFRWLSEAGFMPVPVPNILVEMGQFENWLEQIQPELIVLSGGNNIGDFPQRDRTETELLNYAAEHHIPLLGICRGMQMIAKWKGTDLVPVTGHVRTRHYLRSESDTISLPESVNSYHDFAIMNCPDGFEVVTRSDDGYPEAIKHKSLPIEGWMWHPEREPEFAELDIINLNRLANSKQ